ncbi:hypothetical protein JCM15415_21900 [Methanobacterium movens]
MGIFDQVHCPKEECDNKKGGEEGKYCPKCGSEYQKFGFRDGTSLLTAKENYKKRVEKIGDQSLIEEMGIDKAEEMVEEAENEAKIIEEKIKRENERKKRDEVLKKGSKEFLFTPYMDDESISDEIFKDMQNLANQEAGTKWMRIGTLLSFNSTEQMIGAGFKAIIDQNKLLIRQNELILRELKRISRKDQD